MANEDACFGISGDCSLFNTFNRYVRILSNRRVLFTAIDNVYCVGELNLIIRKSGLKYSDYLFQIITI